MSRRFLFIFFPFFSAEILSSQKKFPSHRPILVSHNKFGTELVYSMNRSAANSGIFPSMPITDALSIQSNCLILEKSMLREQFLEQMLIKELRKFSPWISKKTNNSFILNITGCSHLFNGEKEMAKKISLTLKSIGLSSSIGIGDSPSSAMAAAIFVDSHSMILKQNNNILTETYINHEARASRFKSAIKPKSEKYSERTFTYQILDQKAESFISKLPVELLNLDSKELDDLYFLGLKKISHLFELKKCNLTEYFGKDLLNKLNTILGVRSEPISPFVEEYKPICFKEFLYPIISKDTLILELENILKRIIKKLEKTQDLIKKILITFFLSKNNEIKISLSLKEATKDIDFIISLLKVKIDNTIFFSSIRKLIASVEETERNGHIQCEIESFPNKIAKLKNRDLNENYKKSIAKISARIGYENIRKIFLKNTHIPEKATSLVPIHTEIKKIHWQAIMYNMRPIYLFSPKKINVEKFSKKQTPRALIFGGMKRHISVAFGPEIIDPEWWYFNSAWELHTRNYWIVELTEGQKLWIFELTNGKFSNQWYIHGNFC